MKTHAPFREHLYGIVTLGFNELVLGVHLPPLAESKFSEGTDIFVFVFVS